MTSDNDNLSEVIVAIMHADFRSQNGTQENRAVKRLWLVPFPTDCQFPSIRKVGVFQP